MVNKKYVFADVSLEVESELPILPQENYSQFKNEKISSEKRFYIKECSLPAKEGKIIYNNGLTSLYETEKGKLFFTSYPSSRIEYRDYSCLEVTPDGGKLYISPGEELRDSSLMKSVNIYGIVLENNTAVFHCSFIIMNGEAILFTGRSGIGKTTQARLWKKYKGALIVNDDRAAIKTDGDKLFAIGVPISGSSRIALDKTAPVKAIIILEQGSENRIEELPSFQNLISIMNGIIFEPHDQREKDKALSVAESVIKTAKILKMTCTPDESAVEALDGYLSNH